MRFCASEAAVYSNFCNNVNITMDYTAMVYSALAIQCIIKSVVKERYTFCNIFCQI